MMHPYPIRSVCIAIFLVMVVFGGCETTQLAKPTEQGSAYTGRVIALLTPQIETLYLDWHELDQIYKDIKFLERGLLFDPDDRMLGYVQKATLYIQDASIRIHHQWEQLSIIRYIRDDGLRDYLTLRVKGLASAIDAVGYDEMFLKIYRPSIAQKAVQAEIDQALDCMNKLKASLNQIRDMIMPFCHVSGGTEI